VKNPPHKERAPAPSLFDVDKAKTLVTTSGNRFQCKVANYFRDLDWTVLMSPYYVDSSSDKTRELDLIVEHHFQVPQLWGHGAIKFIAVRLFIECKYIANGAVFWFDNMDAGDARDWIHTSTGGCFTANNLYINQHHYLKRGDSVAKLFQSENKQKGGEDIDPFFRTVNQCLNGYIHNKSRPLLIEHGANTQITQLNYPVVICSSFDQFFMTHTAADPDIEPPAQLQDDFGLEVNYAYLDPSRRSIKQYFLLDVLGFGRLDGFLNALETEVKAAMELVQDR
jgi:hypothetical protein